MYAAVERAGRIATLAIPDRTRPRRGSNPISWTCIEQSNDGSSIHSEPILVLLRNCFVAESEYIFSKGVA
jgi:hypothetical protein